MLLRFLAHIWSNWLKMEISYFQQSADKYKWYKMV